MRLHDYILSGLLLVLALAIAGYASTFPSMPGQGIGPGFFPTLIAAGIALAALAVLAATAARREAAPLIELDPWARSPRRLFDMLLLIGGMLLYIFLSEPLGYLIAAPIALLMFLIATHVRPLIAVPVAALVPLLIHYIFYTGLRVPLPWGLLAEHAW